MTEEDDNISKIQSLEKKFEDYKKENEKK